ANQVRDYLLAHSDFMPGDIVALYVERTAQMMVAILAILKAGGTYLPLDPNYPKSRTEYMLEDSGATCILTEEALEADLQSFTLSTLCMCEAKKADNIQPVKIDTQQLPEPSSNAYIIYTSGTTGKPKGVAIQHQGAVNLAFALAERLPSGPNARVLQFSVPCFDASVFEWIWALTQGASLYICSDGVKLQPQTMAQYLEDNQITHTCLTPSYIAYLPYHERYSFKVLGACGEACSEELGWRWANHYPVFNLYGPTEVTICASISQVNVNEAITIGRPLPNTALYVLNSDQQLCPLGVAGELYVAGQGVACGYVNRPSLTADRFVNVPNIALGKRLYRTGDLVRYLANGDLEYLSRADEQIKIRGHRVEPLEVERQITLLENIHKAVVNVDQDSQGHTRMIAYIEAKEAVAQPSAFTEQVKRQLRASLPIFMVPSSIIFMQEWPLQPSGKVDKSALAKVAMDIDEKKVLPRNEVETVLVQIWQTLLSIPSEQIGVYDHFMELGGHSLLLVRLLAEINQHWQLELTLAELIANPDIASLGEKVMQLLTIRTLKEQVNRTDIVEEGTL
ncbi:non-ribosomal peptide synthetase, partial [Pseudoalteromonas sp. MMG005]|uniref:non-ribosomal peptide synthetase n=1 Tax=Pseudoalteromonas sp. MMG005 TaxID=2822682 RepID=UPI001B39E8AF